MPWIFLLTWILNVELRELSSCARWPLWRAKRELETRNTWKVDECRHKVRINKTPGNNDILYRRKWVMTKDHYKNEETVSRPQPDFEKVSENGKLVHSLFAKSVIGIKRAISKRSAGSGSKTYLSIGICSNVTRHFENSLSAVQALVSEINSF